MNHDAELLLAFARSRDEHAFKILVERHQTLVLGTCRRICAEDAEDAAQAVFLVVSRKAGPLATHPSFGAWLHRTAMHISRRIRDAARARRRREQEGAMTTIMTSERIEDVGLEEALQSLPGTYREVVVRHYLGGQDHDQVATALGITREATAMRLSRGRHLLRSLLERGRGPATAVLALAALDNAAAAIGECEGFSARTAASAASFHEASEAGSAAGLARAHLCRARSRAWVTTAAVIGAIGVSSVLCVLAMRGEVSAWPTMLPTDAASGKSAVNRGLVTVVGQEPLLTDAGRVWTVQDWIERSGGETRRIEVTIYVDEESLHRRQDLGDDQGLLRAQIACRGACATIDDLAREIHRSLPVRISVEEGGDSVIPELPGRRTDLAVQLDLVCAPLGLSWSVREGGIVIRRVPTIHSVAN